MTDIAIIGGGLAGLTAALRLAPRHRVTLLEAGSRLGGQIWTTLDAGFVIERGAEGFVARSEAVPKLAADLGMPDAVIGQSVMSSYGFDGRQLVALAPGEAARFLGFQVPDADLGRGIRSLRRGMGSLIGAFEGALDGAIAMRRGARVVAVARRGAGVELRLADGTEIAAEQLLVATSARAAAELLADVAGEPALALCAAPVTSSVTVELAFERAQIDHPLDGTGFVVQTDHQQHGLRACTFTSAKFADRAPAGRVSLRAFFRPSAHDLVALDDAAWRARAISGVGRVLTLSGEPIACWVSPWPDALPVFTDAHRQRVAELERALVGQPITLAGAAFHGSGIDAAVRSGESAAQRLAPLTPSRGTLP